MTVSFTDDLDALDGAFWVVSNYANPGSWVDTGFSPDRVTVADDVVTLTLDLANYLDKNFTGGEFYTTQEYGFGRYEVVMQPSGEQGVNSSFFLYTGSEFGDPLSEIDFEFLGRSPTEVSLAYHTDEGSFSTVASLGFDASAALHTYAFEWGPDSIAWYAEGTLLYSVEDPDLAVPGEPGRIFMNIWTGSPQWLGEPDFGASATAVYDSVSFVARTAPVAADDMVETGRGEAVVIDVLANDYDPDGSLDATSVQVVNEPANGTVMVDPVTGAVTYSPDAAFQGIDTFSYTVSDGGELSNTGEVAIAVGYTIFEGFATGAGPFTYTDDAFGTAEPDRAYGEAADGVLRVALGEGGPRSLVENISGGWSTGFDTVAGQSGTLTLRYRVELAAPLDAGEV
ncbi:MAG: family 16 glycosylhydrolase, partial [Pseudomonadota bacterium]